MSSPSRPSSPPTGCMVLSRSSAAVVVAVCLSNDFGELGSIDASESGACLCCRCVYVSVSLCVCVCSYGSVCARQARATRRAQARSRQAQLLLAPLFVLAYGASQTQQQMAAGSSSPSPAAADSLRVGAARFACGSRGARKQLDRLRARAQ